MANKERIIPISTIGGRIRARRNELGKSKTWLYDEVMGDNLTSDANKGKKVDKWELNSNVDAEELQGICSALGVSADYLLGMQTEKTHDNHFICEQTGLSENTVESLKHLKFMCKPENVFYPVGAKMTLKGDPTETDVTPFKMDKDSAIGQMKFATENQMLINTIDGVISDRGVLNILMNYLYFDRINEVSVNDLKLVPKLGIVQVNGLVMIGSGAIKNGLLTELGKSLDRMIDDMNHDGSRQQLIDLFLG